MARTFDVSLKVSNFCHFCILQVVFCQDCWERVGHFTSKWKSTCDDMAHLTYNMERKSQNLCEDAIHYNIYSSRSEEYQSRDKERTKSRPVLKERSRYFSESVRSAKTSHSKSILLDRRNTQIKLLYLKILTNDRLVT